MADFRLRLGFAKTGAGIWLSHLEVVRAMERCVRRSGLPYAISQGFSPHMKHSFSSALPVGTGSRCEYMDVELLRIVPPESALYALQAAQHECLPVLSVRYAAKDEPSLQVAYNHSVYLVEMEDPLGTMVPELVQRLAGRPEIKVRKKEKLKTFDLADYVVALEQDVSPSCATQVRLAESAGMCAEVSPSCATPVRSLCLSLLSRPEGSLRPEVILAAVGEPDLILRITAITRIALEQQEL